MTRWKQNRNALEPQVQRAQSLNYFCFRYWQGAIIAHSTTGRNPIRASHVYVHVDENCTAVAADGRELRSGPLARQHHSQLSHCRRPSSVHSIPSLTFVYEDLATMRRNRVFRNWRSVFPFGRECGMANSKKKQQHIKPKDMSINRLGFRFDCLLFVN